MTNDNQIQTNETDISANDKLALALPILQFLHDKWWRIKSCGIDFLPNTGPALIVGNTSGIIPWTALMLLYIVTKEKKRPIHFLTDMNHIQEEKLQEFFGNLNFVPWSYDNAKNLIEQGELIAIFPEDHSVVSKTVASRNRLKRFDWTKFPPALEAKIPVYPLATLGIDEANLVLHNSSFLSHLLEVKAFPVTPFFPWLPFPFNLTTAPVPWRMEILPSLNYDSPTDRDSMQESAKKLALRAEGEIQAEINRLLRAR